MQSLHSGSSACQKNQSQTLDAKFAFWVFCLPKIQGPNLGSSACLKFKAQALDAKFAFWVFCLPKPKAQTLDAKFAFWVFCLPKNSRPKPWMQSLHSGSSACLKSRPKPWMQSLHSGSSACLKNKAQTLDAKFAFWAFCLPKLQGPNLGWKVCILGLLPAQKFKPKPWMQSLHSGSSACLKIQGPNLG